MKISLVLSAYNGASYIIPQLDSLRYQSLKIDEVIIRDDKSTDDTVSIIKNYISRNNLNWIFIQGEENLGWRNAFYELTKLTTGDVIFFCDQDDIWHSRKIEIMSECFNRNNNIHLLVADEYRFQYNNVPSVWPIGDLKVHKYDTSYSWPYIQRPGCVFAFDKSAKELYLRVFKKGDAHDLLMWQIAGALDSIWHIRFNAILFRRHGSNSTPQANRSLEGRLIDVNSLIDVTERLSSDETIRCIAGNRLSAFRTFLLRRQSFLLSKKPNTLVMLLPVCRYYSSLKSFIADILSN